MTTKTTPIPKSVRDMLAERWKYHASYSAFEGPRRYPERLKEPSWYIYRPGDEDVHDFKMLRHSEVKALATEDVFGPFTKEQGETIKVQEHAQHALADFLAGTYAAWAKYLDRLKEIERD